MNIIKQDKEDSSDVFCVTRFNANLPNCKLDNNKDELINLQHSKRMFYKVSLETKACF